MGSSRLPPSALAASFALLLGVATQAQTSSGAPADAVGELVARSQQSFARARYDEAEATLREAARLDPGQVAVWVGLGQACYAQKRWDAALEAFEKARTLAPGDARIDSNIGVCAHERGDLERARAALERVVAASPSDSRAHLFLARIAWSKGEPGRAEQLFAKSLACERPEPIAPYYQGLFLYQERRLAEARSAFERALQSMPGHVASHMNLGLVLDRLGESELAERHLARFRELNEVRVADHKRKLEIADRIAAAQRDVDAGHYEAALAHALAAQRVGDEVPAVHALLGRVYQLLGRAEDSGRESARAKELAERERRR